MNATPAPTNGAPADARLLAAEADNERLQAALRDAEQRIAELQRQRDKYYEFTKAWIAQNCSAADWEGFDPAEYTMEFDQAFIDNLEAEFKS